MPESKPTELPPTLRPVKSTGNLQQPPKTVNQTIRNTSPAISSHPRGEDPTNNTGLSRKELKFRAKEQKKIDKQRAAQRKKEANEKAKQEKLKEKAKKEEQKAKRNANKKQGKPTQVQPLPQTSSNNQQPQSSTPVTQPVKTTPVNPTKLPVNKTAQPVAIPTPQLTKTPQPANKTQEPAKNTKPPAPPANKTTQPTVKTTQPANKTTQPAYNTDRESSISRNSGPPPYSELPEPIHPKTDTTGNVVYSKPVDTGSWDIISQHREALSRPAVSNSKRKEVVMDLNYFGGARDNADNSEA